MDADLILYHGLVTTLDRANPSAIFLRSPWVIPISMLGADGAEAASFCLPVLGLVVLLVFAMGFLLVESLAFTINRS